MQCHRKCRHNGGAAAVNVTLQYFDACPNWQITAQRLKDLISSYGLDIHLKHQLIESPEAAERHEFHGSPSILIDGQDPFATKDTRVGFACRIYQAGSGSAEAPSIDQLKEALGVE